jgi:hypothetical protein
MIILDSSSVPISLPTILEKSVLSNRMDRRRFLKNSVIAGGALLAGMKLAALETAASLLKFGKERSWNEIDEKMGIFCSYSAACSPGGAGYYHGSSRVADLG